MLSGKALASGMPLAALVGRTRRFHELMARTRYNPTFKAETYSLAAAKAAIEIYRREPVAERIAATGTRMKTAIDASCREHGVPAACRGPAFRFHLVFDDPDAYRQRLERRAPVPGPAGGAHHHRQRRRPSERRALAGDRRRDPAAFDRVVATMAEAERAGTLERAVEIRSCKRGGGRMPGMMRLALALTALPAARSRAGPGPRTPLSLRRRARDP